MLEQTRYERRVFREGDHAVADVAWWEHLQLITQAPRTATVIRDSHDRGETFDPDWFFTLANKTFQTGEQRRKPCATADCYKLLTSCVYLNAQRS